MKPSSLRLASPYGVKRPDEGLICAYEDETSVCVSVHSRIRCAARNTNVDVSQGSKKMNSNLKMKYTPIWVLAMILLPNVAMAQDVWDGMWTAAKHSVDGMVCRQEWKCADPLEKRNQTATGQLVFEPQSAFTTGVCEGSQDGTGCGKCIAEEPPETCTVKLTGK